jgi:antitoxin component HigA of HigAB toxin-antitoxin module
VGVRSSRRSSNWALPAEIRELADKNYELLKENPRHPSLQLELILHVMEACGLTRRDLEPYLGSQARVS